MVRSAAILWAAKRVPSIRFRNGSNAGAAASSESVGSASNVSSVSQKVSSLASIINIFLKCYPIFIT